MDAASANGTTDGSGPGEDRADPSRIAQRLRALAAIGADERGGVSRLAFTPSERQAHKLVADWLVDLGLHVRQDALGNTIADRPIEGPRAGAPAIGVGSHLDSVPQGGQYDGTVGVVGAVELIQLLIARRAVLHHPLRVVIFAGEEGARFGEPCIGSKGVVGLLDQRDLGRVRDAQNVTLPQAMASVGLDASHLGASHWRPREWAAFLELHIEQARVLEDEGCRVGLVDIVSGSTRLRMRLVGRADHSGGTPMALRADALAAAAEVVLASEALAKDARHRGTRATVGRLDVQPNSITTIPGAVDLVVDVRDVDSTRQRDSAVEIVQRAQAICQRRGISLEVELIADTSPAVLPMWLREITTASCRELGSSYRVMSSGAGHDAQIVNRIVPAAMLFVPSREGLSHVPQEWTSASDIAIGVEALYESVVRIDAFLAEMDGSPVAETQPA
jgi:hydantoinase/carbamoylase family amidase